MKIKNILVIGDYCVDKFVYCEVDRLSPEACVPVAKPTHEESNRGMAANVLKNIESLSNQPLHLHELFPFSEIVKTRYVHTESGQQIVRIDEGEENIKPLTPKVFEIWLKDNVKNGKLDAVVISDYDKGFLTESMIQHISEKCDEEDIPTFLDTKKKLGAWSELITVVKINEKEYKQLEKSLKDPFIWCKNLIVTLGSLGMIHVNTNIISPTEPVEVACVAGCGDTALAAIVLEYLESQDIKLCMDFANKAAGQAASRSDVVAVKREWI